MKLLPISLGIVAAFLLASCTKDPSADDGRPAVVATTTMVADLARVVAGDRFHVHGLMGPAVDPHNYVPKLGDTTLLEKADVVLYSGLHLEGRFQATLEAMAKRGRNVVAVTSGIDPSSLLSPQEDFEGAKDPHVWGDPLLWAATVDTVVEAFSKADPSGKAEFEKNAEAYKKELRELTRWAADKFSVLPPEKRILVTSHDAFFYFGRAFGFSVRGLQGVSTTVEAGIKDRSDLVDYLRRQKVKTIFAETSINRKGIATVAAEAGVEISGEPLFSDALGTPGDQVTVDGETYDKGTYTGMVKHNVNAIVNGLR